MVPDTFLECQILYTLIQPVVFKREDWEEMGFNFNM